MNTSCAFNSKSLHYLKIYLQCWRWWSYKTSFVDIFSVIFCNLFSLFSWIQSSLWIYMHYFQWFMIIWCDPKIIQDYAVIVSVRKWSRIIIHHYKFQKSSFLKKIKVAWYVMYCNCSSCQVIIMGFTLHKRKLYVYSCVQVERLIAKPSTVCLICQQNRAMKQ